MVRFGVVLPIAQEDGQSAPPDWPEIRDVAVAIESAGFDSIWVYDHLLFRFDGETTGIHEAWTVLTAAAAVTTTPELGILVMATEYRNPALLAKMAATLDHISGGRLILGVGCGWHDPEYIAFGYPTDHKVSRFEDSLKIITELIRTGRSDHRGTFHTVDDAVLMPPARPDLPILIAAKRPRMLGLTARYADAWNQAWFGEPDERLARVRADLAAVCLAEGRDPSTLTDTVGVNVWFDDLISAQASGSGEVSPTEPSLRGSAEEVAAGLLAHAEAGTEHVIVSLEPTTPAAVGRLAQAVRLARDQIARSSRSE